MSEHTQDFSNREGDEDDDNGHLDLNDSTGSQGEEDADIGEKSGEKGEEKRSEQIPVNVNQNTDRVETDAEMEDPKSNKRKLGDITFSWYKSVSLNAEIKHRDESELALIPPHESRFIKEVPSFTSDMEDAKERLHQIQSLVVDIQYPEWTWPFAWLIDYSAWARRLNSAAEVAPHRRLLRVKGIAGMAALALDVTDRPSASAEFEEVVVETPGMDPEYRYSLVRGELERESGLMVPVMCASHSLIWDAAETRLSASGQIINNESVSDYCKIVETYLAVRSGGWYSRVEGVAVLVHIASIIILQLIDVTGSASPDANKPSMAKLSDRLIDWVVEVYSFYRFQGQALDTSNIVFFSELPDLEYNEGGENDNSTWTLDPELLLKRSVEYWCTWLLVEVQALMTSNKDDSSPPLLISMQVKDEISKFWKNSKFDERNIKQMSKDKTRFLPCVHDWLFFSNRAIVLDVLSKLNNEIAGKSILSQEDNSVENERDVYNLADAFTSHEQYILHGISTENINKEFYHIEFGEDASKELDNIPENWPSKWEDFNTITIRSVVAKLVENITTAETTNPDGFFR